ncbi:MAG: hypothetical protein HOU81_19615 [Hamadaea sp.]|uniref:hypothetical protein n=1 Tax=Hamadaea sp. TaxID=2024425 RepID=UPI001814B17C|nr:hypothetical protein [Hamadaea sp.]NUR73031.1 hypothetical protein [Hamadaea sp.]NUT22991.1 hypothetical protein [Hamadaea sp.]
MRPQHDDHDGRPSPRTQTPKPDLWTDTQTFFLERIREDRPEGETGRHRLAKSAKPAGKTPDAKRATETAERFLTPAGPLTPGVGPVRALHSSAKAGRVVALGLIALLGVSVAASERGNPTQLDNASQQVADRNTIAEAADRSAPRVTASVSPTPSVSATPSPSPTVKKVVTSVKPVAGLDQKQMNNALTIVKTGQKLGVSQRGLLVGIMTAMQESDLYNQASSAVPESFDYAHEGSSVDYDSCGLFQQRTSMGWGTVKQIMNPTYSSTKFFQSLLRVSGWQNMELTLAAQAVQGSAYPYAYAKHETTARKVLTAILAAL